MRMFTITNRVNQLAKTVKREQKQFSQINFDFAPEGPPGPLGHIFFILGLLKCSESIENPWFYDFFQNFKLHDYLSVRDKLSM